MVHGEHHDYRRTGEGDGFQVVEEVHGDEENLMVYALTCKSLPAASVICVNDSRALKS